MSTFPERLQIQALPGHESQLYVRADRVPPAPDPDTREQLDLATAWLENHAKVHPLKVSEFRDIKRFLRNLYRNWPTARALDLDPEIRERPTLSQLSDKDREELAQIAYHFESKAAARTTGPFKELEEKRAAFLRNLASHQPEEQTDGEICKRCGRPVEETCPTFWTAPDDLWNEVEGGPAGIRCIPCFARDCEEAGVFISWRAVRESAPEPQQERERAR